MIGKRRMIFGVAINDAEYQVSASPKRNGKTFYICPYYARWKDMVSRCLSVKLKSKYKTYEECSIHEDWLYFSNFRSWMQKQDWIGKQLDKDILVKGNKLYSPETCCFVTSATNTFILNDHASPHGKLPGSHMLKANGRFQSSCANPFTGKKEHLGTFGTEQEAHEKWLIRKRELAIKLSHYQEDFRVAISLRNRY